MPEIVPTRQRRARRQHLTDVGVSKLPRRSTPYFHPDPLLVGHGTSSATPINGNAVGRTRMGPGAYTVTATRNATCSRG